MSVSSRIAAMQRQEESFTYRCSDYLPKKGLEGWPSATAEVGPVDASCRAKLVEWNRSITEFFGLSRDTVSVATSYMDRYLSSGTEDAQQALFDTQRYQLLFMTSLFIAVKINEPKDIDPSLLSKLSNGKYKAKDFIETERKMLKALNWRLSCPTAMDFVWHFLSLLPTHGVIPGLKSVIMDFARQQIEIAVGDYNLVSVKPSEIAVSAILNGIATIDYISFSSRHRLEFGRRMRDVSKIDTSSDRISKIQKELKMMLEKSQREKQNPTHKADKCIKERSVRSSGVKDSALKPNTQFRCKH